MFIQRIMYCSPIAPDVFSFRTWGQFSFQLIIKVVGIMKTNFIAVEWGWDLELVKKLYNLIKEKYNFSSKRFGFCVIKIFCLNK